MHAIVQVKLYQRFGDVLKGESLWRRLESQHGLAVCNLRKDLYDLNIDTSLVCDWQLFALIQWALDSFRENQEQQLAQALIDDCCSGIMRG